MGDDEVGVGVEAGQQLAGVVVEVGLDLVAAADGGVLLALMGPSEAGVEFGGAAVGRVRQRPGQAQAPHGADGVGVVVAVEEEGVRHDGELLEVAPGELVGGGRGAGGHEHQVAYPLRVADGPFDGAVPAQGGADDQVEGIDSQGVRQARLGCDGIACGQPWEARAPGAAVGCDGGGAGRALAPAQDVGGDDEVAVGVDGPAGADQVAPPARCGVAGTGLAGHVGVAGQRMQDQDGVVVLGGQLAPGLEGEVGVGQNLAGLQGQVADLHEAAVAGVVAGTPRAGGGARFAVHEFEGRSADAGGGRWRAHGRHRIAMGRGFRFLGCRLPGIRGGDVEIGPKNRSRCGVRPISSRSTTDLGAECDRSRRGWAAAR